MSFFYHCWKLWKTQVTVAARNVSYLAMWTCPICPGRLFFSSVNSEFSINGKKGSWKFSFGPRIQ